MFFLIGLIASLVMIPIEQPLETYAQSVVNECKNSAFTPTCYDKAIPKLLLPMEDAFEVTKKIQILDPSYSYCHVLGHELSAAETKKDVSRWKDVIGRCPKGMCSNGCIHGAFQERFRTDAIDPKSVDAIRPELVDVCEPRSAFQPTRMEQATCYHAFGHLLMYITKADIDASVTSCNDMTLSKSGDFRAVCYDGAFMQLFQPLEPEDFALIKGKEPTKDTVKDLCGRFLGQPKGSCISESWPLFRDLLVRSPQFILSYCSSLSGEIQDRCHKSLLYVVTVQLRMNDARLTSYCLSSPKWFQGMCFGQVASRYVEIDWKNIDRAVAWCKNVSPIDTDRICMKELASQGGFNFIPGSPEQKQLCSKLPKDLQRICFRQ